MIQLLRQYAAYNYWANERIVGLIKNLTEEQSHRELVSSFSSIHKTLVHLRGAELVWWLRVSGQPWNKEMFAFTGTTPELCDVFIQQSAVWKDWVAGMDEALLPEMLTYQSFAGDTYTQPFGEILQHVFNHSTYHRGQFVTMLRQVGVESIPSTDFIAYTRIVNNV